MFLWPLQDRLGRAIHGEDGKEVRAARDNDGLLLRDSVLFYLFIGLSTRWW